jgi:ribosomal protein S18 acetylase RimI-like enzyme
MTTATITLRPLTALDAPALLAFYNGLSPASIRTFRPLGLKTTLDVCEKIVADASAPAAARYDLGAWQGDTMVGWGFVSGLDKAEPEFGLCVADAWQGQGVGKALIDGVLDYAQVHGLPRVYLIAVRDNARAIGLYSSRGFTQYGEMTGEWDGLPYVKMVVAL